MHWGLSSSNAVIHCLIQVKHIAIIDMFITTNQITMCQTKGFAYSDHPMENYH